MEKIKFAIYMIAGTAKKELMVQELTELQIAEHLENGLKDLRKLISFYVLNKKGEYRIEIGEKGFNFIGNRFASSLSQVFHMVAAKEMASQGRGAEMKNIQELAESFESRVKIDANVLDYVNLADKALDGSHTAIEQLSRKLLPETAENE